MLFYSFFLIFLFYSRREEKNYLQSFSLGNLGCNRVANYLFQYATNIKFAHTHTLTYTNKPARPLLSRLKCQTVEWINECMCLKLIQRLIHKSARTQTHTHTPVSYTLACKISACSLEHLHVYICMQTDNIVAASWLMTQIWIDGFGVNSNAKIALRTKEFSLLKMRRNILPS